MRLAVTIAAFLLLAQGAGKPGFGQGVQACRIFSVDTVSMNFVCRTNGVMRQYWVTQATQFLTRGTNASFFRLQSGERVQVVSHASGRLQIADRVVS